MGGEFMKGLVPLAGLAITVALMVYLKSKWKRDSLEERPERESKRIWERAE